MRNVKKLVLLLIVVPVLAFAQEESGQDTVKLWTKEGNVILNFSQVSLTNWAAGGRSSGSGVMLVNLKANYKKEKVSWENSADLGLGFLKEGKDDPRKTEDKIDLNSKLGVAMADTNWYYTFNLNFKSQFAPGYNYPNTTDMISRFLAPGYLTAGLGVDYKREKLSVLMAPLSAKFTFVTDEELSEKGAFGVDPGQKTRSELGATVKISYKTEVVENVTFETKLDLFSNYLDKPQNIDVDWNVLVNMKINDYLSANLSTRLIYDDDVIIDIDNDHDGVIDESGRRIQFMEMFGAGLSLKF